MKRRFIMTPLGPMEMVEEGGFVRKLTFVEEIGVSDESPLLLQGERELIQYFQGERIGFSLPLAPGGTAFQEAVWAALLAIPYGKTVTYGTLAASLGIPKGARAVGGACNKNSLPILIPFHRVLGKGGQLTGYNGGLGIKEFLLRLESPV